VFAAEGIRADAVLLVVMNAAETDTEDVVRPLPGARIGRRAQMGKVDTDRPAIGDAAAMRFDPAAMPGQTLCTGMRTPIRGRFSLSGSFITDLLFRPQPALEDRVDLGHALRQPGTQPGFQ
jgi:hypothetical protein